MKDPSLDGPEPLPLGLVSEDIEAIKRLKARYFRTMDTKDWDAMSEVFAADLEGDFTEDAGGRVIHGRDKFMSYVRAAVGNVTTVHHGHMPEIEIDSPTTAHGVWAMEDELWWPEGSPIKYMHGYGHYHESYEKTDRGWVIKTIRLTRLNQLFES
jgi:hypothetical protein